MRPIISYAKDISLTLVLAFSCAMPAYADIEEQYLRDKNIAMKQVTTKLEKTCLEDIARKTNSVSEINPAGKPVFNDRISRMVYRDFYWNKADRGVAFIVPVKAHDKRMGDISTDIACFYAVTESGLEFQLSQQFIWKL